MSVQSSEALMTPSPAVLALGVAPQLSQSTPPLMMLVSPKNADESSEPLTTPSPFRSARFPKIVGDTPPVRALAVAGPPARNIAPSNTMLATDTDPNRMRLERTFLPIAPPSDRCGHARSHPSA